MVYHNTDISNPQLLVAVEDFFYFLIVNSVLQWGQVTFKIGNACPFVFLYVTVNSLLQFEQMCLKLTFSTGLEFDFTYPHEHCSVLFEFLSPHLGQIYILFCFLTLDAICSKFEF